MFVEFLKAPQSASRKSASKVTEKAVIVTLGKRDENQRLLAETLREMNYKVETTANKAELSSTLLESPGPDLSIIDIDGYDPDIWDISQQFAERSIPILIVTSADADRVQAEGGDYGIGSVLSKPLDGAELTTTINLLLK
jgi:DNA-binding response OmpR family regulator